VPVASDLAALNRKLLEDCRADETHRVSLRPPFVAADRHDGLIRALIFVVETPSAPRVISVVTLGRGVVIAFEDGKVCSLVVGSSARNVAQAEELKETDSAEPISASST